MRETIQNANGKQFHAVSLSGGKDSTAMLLLMIERGMPIDMVLSADTGMEFPEMYKHLAELDEHLFRERGIHITTLRHPKGFEYLMFDEPKQKPRSLENRAKLGIPPYGNGWPGIRVRWCTVLAITMPYRRGGRFFSVYEKFFVSNGLIVIWSLMSKYSFSSPLILMLCVPTIFRV